MLFYLKNTFTSHLLRKTCVEQYKNDSRRWIILYDERSRFKKRKNSLRSYIIFSICSSFFFFYEHPTWIVVVVMSVSDKRLILQSLIFFSFLICQKQRRLANLEISNYTIISRISQEMRRAQCAVLAYAISKKGYLYNLGVTISAALCTIVPTALFSIRSAISRGALQLTETLSIEGFTTMCTVKPSNNFDYSLLARILYDLLSSSSLLLMVMVVAADGAARRKVHPFCF